MTWFWRVITGLIILNVVFVFAALVRSVIRDRKETMASENREAHTMCHHVHAPLSRDVVFDRRHKERAGRQIGNGS